MSLPLEAPPYGKDTSCTDRLHAGRVVKGIQLLGEAAFRRVTTDRGSLESDPDYGRSIQSYIGLELDEDEFETIGPELRGELEKDPRFAVVVVTVERTGSGPIAELTVTAEITASNGEQFRLAIRVDEVSAELLFVEAA